VQEGHTLVADVRRGGPLFRFPQACQHERIGPWIIGARVTAGAAHEVGDTSIPDPAGDGAGRAEVGVIRVRHDDHESLGALRVERGVRVGHTRIRRLGHDA